MRLISFILLLICHGAYAQQKYNEWILQSTQDQVVGLDKSLAANKMDVNVLSKDLGAYLIIAPTEVTAAELINTLQLSTKEWLLSPNYTIDYRQVEPNDPMIDDQYSLDLIQARDAWNITTGGQYIDGEEIVIAILDDGFQENHTDLSDRFWTNSDEVPGDGIDNDNNGYIDDYRGLNIQTLDDNHHVESHGTRVAGIFGAITDNDTGIAAVDWNTRVLYISNVTNVAEIIKSFDYIYQLKRKYLLTNGQEGANIVVNNFSAGLRRHFPSEFPAWCNAYTLLGSVGVLSIGAVPNENYDLSAEGDLPTLCNSNHLIMVTNTNRFDAKVANAAVSTVYVDIGAPGENIHSTDINNSYDLINGTSAATPHVTGAVSLLFSASCDAIRNLIQDNPSAGALEIKTALLNGVDTLPSLSRTVSKGRLNVFKALLALGDQCGSEGNIELEVRSIGAVFYSNYNLDIEVEYDTDTFKPHTIMLFDMVGHLIHKEEFSPNIFLEKRISINNLAIPPGMYIISITDNDRVASKKFVVSK